MKASEVGHEAEQSVNHHVEMLEQTTCKCMMPKGCAFRVHETQLRETANEVMRV